MDHLSTVGELGQWCGEGRGTHIVLILRESLQPAAHSPWHRMYTGHSPEDSGPSSEQNRQISGVMEFTF